MATLDHSVSSEARCLRLDLSLRLSLVVFLAKRNTEMHCLHQIVCARAQELELARQYRHRWMKRMMPTFHLELEYLVLEAVVTQYSLMLMISWNEESLPLASDRLTQ